MERIRLNGRPLDPAGRYRVTVNEFLADGGDAFSVFTQGSDRIFSIYDVDALASYFAGNSPLSPPPLDRIRRTD
jgi:5'-nucleotidase